MLRSALALLLLLCVSLALAQIDGFDVGSWGTESLDLGSKENPLPQFAPYHVNVRYPLKCNSQCGAFQTGGVPVLLFVTGFAGTLPASHYTSLLNNIARHGIIVVTVDQDLTGFQLTLNFKRFGQQLQKVIEYISNGELLSKIRAPGGGKQPFTNSAGLFSTPSGVRIFYAGHSSGAHIAVQNVVDIVAQNKQCPPQLAGFVLLSPLDGQDPLGFGGEFAISPYHHDRLLFTTPGLILAGELDQASGDVIKGFPCVPHDRGNLHFFEGWPGYVQYTEAAGMGTLDVLDESISTIYDQHCARSNKTTQANDRARYRTMVRGSVVSFIQAVVTGTPAYLAKLTNAGDLNFPVSLSKTNEATSTLGCAYFPKPFSIGEEQELGLVLFVITFCISFVFGLCYIFQKMDAETTHRYHTHGEGGFEGAASFQTKLEPSYSQPAYVPSQNYGNPRQVSINV